MLQPGISAEVKFVVTDGSPNLTATFWERVEDPSQQQTTVFQLPSVLGFEKAGIRASGGRLLQHAEAAVEPAAESRTDAAIIGDMWERVFTCTTPRAVRRRIRSLRPGGTT